MSKHTYADSTLKSWTKDELIHQIRILEHNVAVKQELVNNQAKLLKTWAPVVRCKDCQKWGERKADGYGYCCAFGTAMQENSFCGFGVKEDNAPAADVAPAVHAHWIEDSSEYYDICYSRGQTPEQTEYLTESDVACSACLRKFNTIDNSFTYECANYCPNCGTKMDGGDGNVWRCSRR